MFLKIKELVGQNAVRKCLIFKTCIKMLLIEDYFIKANYNARQCDFYEPKLVEERNFNRFYREYHREGCLKRGNLNRFFLMRDRNRRETSSLHSPDVYKKTDEKGNIVQIKWLNGDLETFCYDEKGYVIQYEYYIGGEFLCRKETTSYLYSSDSVRIAEVTNTFYPYKQYCGDNPRYIQSQEYKVVRDVYEYYDNGKAFKSQRFFTNIPFEIREYYNEINEEYEKYTCEEYLAYEQFYDGKWDILKKRLSYNQEGEIVEVALYTESSNDNNFGTIVALLSEEYNKETHEGVWYSLFYSPPKLDIDYQTLSTFEDYNFVNRWGDIRLGSVIFDQEGNIDNGYILSYEGSNFEDSGDWPKYEVGRENAEGKEVWGYEYDWRGYNWEIRLFENGENNQRIASEVTLSTNEAVSVFMPM